MWLRRSSPRRGAAAILILCLLGVASSATPAAADIVIGDCTIVSDPTPEHHTSCPGANLAGADLNSLGLWYADFSGADLSGANLLSAVLYGADLRGADLSHANMWDVSVWTADLTGADLSFARLVNASANGNFTDANLTGTDLSQSNLEGAVLTGATLTGANFSNSTVAPYNQNLATTGTGEAAFWPPLGELPGLHPGACSTPSGTVFPIGVTTVNCTFTDDFDNGATASFTVTVVAGLPAVILHPVDTTAVRGNPAPFHAIATGPFGRRPAVQWQESSDGGATFTDIPGATETYDTDIPGATNSYYYRWPANADSGRQFRAVFTNEYGSVATNAATLTVIPMIIAVGQASVIEGDAGTAHLRVPISLSAAPFGTLGVHWATGRVTGAPGPQATPGTDYVASSGTLILWANQMSGYIDITVQGDTVAEPDEYVAVRLTTDEGDLTTPVGFGAILDDDTPPRIVPGVATEAEGAAGTTSVQVPVSLTFPWKDTVTAEWLTIYTGGAPGDQADPASDYQPASGTIVFAPGETTATITIGVTGDVAFEPDEYVVVSVRNPTHATMGGFWGLGFGVITNDDPPPG